MFAILLPSSDIAWLDTAYALALAAPAVAAIAVDYLLRRPRHRPPPPATDDMRVGAVRSHTTSPPSSTRAGRRHRPS